MCRAVHDRASSALNGLSVVGDGLGLWLLRLTLQQLQQLQLTLALMEPDAEPLLPALLCQVRLREGHIRAASSISVPHLYYDIAAPFVSEDVL